MDSSLSGIFCSNKLIPLKRLKVILLGSYPTYRFVDELGMPTASVHRITSWNETLAEALALLPGVEVCFITRSKAKKTIIIKNGDLSIRYLSVSKTVNAMTLFMYTAWKANEVIKTYKPDIVHGIGTEHIWPTVALMSGYPAVVTVHGIVKNIRKKLHFSLFSKQKWLFEVFSLLERHVLHQTKHLITISPYVMTSLGQLTKAKTFSIENPTSMRFFNATAQPAKSQKILFVGDTGQRKSLLTLLQAFFKLKVSGQAHGWQVAVVGPISSGPYHTKIMKFIREHHLEDQIIFKGFMLPDALEEEYQTSALLALASIEETAPMCIAEAMAVGLPVVATNVAGVPHMVADKRTGFLCGVNQPSEMAEHMRTLIEAPRLRAEMGKRAKIVAKERWHPDHIAQQTLSVYHNILGM